MQIGYRLEVRSSRRRGKDGKKNMTTDVTYFFSSPLDPRSFPKVADVKQMASCLIIQ